MYLFDRDTFCDPCGKKIVNAKHFKSIPLCYELGDYEKCCANMECFKPFNYCHSCNAWVNGKNPNRSEKWQIGDSFVCPTCHEGVIGSFIDGYFTFYKSEVLYTYEMEDDSLI